MIKQRKGEKVRGKKCFSEFDMKDFKLTFGRDNEFGNEMIAPFLSFFFGELIFVFPTGVYR